MKKLCYKKLWKMLIDRDMKKKDLSKLSGVSTTSLAKMKRNENVTTDNLVRICEVLNCDISDIAEIIDEEQEMEEKTNA